jgi:hypothetical protein
VTPLLISLATFALVFGGAFLGTYVRNALSEEHLREDVRDVIKLSTGLIGTMAALVLGLLIASAKSSYDSKSTQIKQITANIIILDLNLERYGPDAQNLRMMLRSAIPPLINQFWNEGDRARFPTPVPANAGTMPAHQGLRPDDRDCPQDRRKPSIQLDQEQAIVVCELDTTSHLAPQHGQLMSERGILRFKSAFRPQRRDEQRQKEA